MGHWTQIPQSMEGATSDSIQAATKRFEALTTLQLYDILQVRSEVFVVEQEIVYLDADALDQQSTHMVLLDGDTIAAYLRIIDHGAKVADAVSIGRVLVRQAYRGRGLARQIMTTAIEYVQSTGEDIEIEAQAHLLEFYRSLGFEVRSEPYMLEGIRHIRMRLDAR